MPWMEIWTLLYIVLLCALMFLHVLSLPANWAVLALILIWKLAHPALEFGWSLFGVLVVVCVVGEIIEFITKYYGAKRFGGSRRGGWGGILGAIVGGILGAPILFGLGAIPGALLGAFAGCLFMEMDQGRPFSDAKRAAWGAMLGNFAGMVAKLGLGIFMLVLAIPRLWPN